MSRGDYNSTNVYQHACRYRNKPTERCTYTHHCTACDIEDISVYIMSNGTYSCTQTCVHSSFRRIFVFFVIEMKQYFEVALNQRPTYTQRSSCTVRGCTAVYVCCTEYTNIVRCKGKGLDACVNAESFQLSFFCYLLHIHNNFFYLHT